MKTRITTIALAIVCVSAAALTAQDNPVAQRLTNNGTPVIYRHASTFAEGVQRGRADVIRAHGDYNYNTSLAAVNYQEARRRSMENDIQYVQTYFERQRLNRQYRNEKHPRLTNQQYAHAVRKRQPTELTAAQINRAFNVVHWPAVLQDDALKSEREAVEALLVARNHSNSGKDSTNYEAAREVIGMMNAKVIASAKELGTRKYFVARRFLNGLQLEFEAVVDPTGIAMR